MLYSKDEIEPREQSFQDISFCNSLLKTTPPQTKGTNENSQHSSSYSVPPNFMGIATSTSRNSDDSHLDHSCPLMSTEPPQDHQAVLNDNSLPFEEQETNSGNPRYSLSFEDVSDPDAEIETKSDICEWNTTLPGIVEETVNETATVSRLARTCVFQEYK